MRDEGLVSAALEDGVLRIRALHREGKADLDSHPLVMKLRDFRRRFAEGR